MGCYLQKKSKEILLIQSPTSADYLSVCSFWKHIGKNREYLNGLTNLIFNLHAKNIHDFSTVDMDGFPLPLSIFLMVEMAISDMFARISFTQKLHSVYIMYICEICFSYFLRLDSINIIIIKIYLL